MKYKGDSEDRVLRAAGLSQQADARLHPIHVPPVPVRGESAAELLRQLSNIDPAVESREYIDRQGGSFSPREIIEAKLGELGWRT